MRGDQRCQYGEPAHCCCFGARWACGGRGGDRTGYPAPKTDYGSLARRRRGSLRPWRPPRRRRGSREATELAAHTQKAETLTAFITHTDLRQDPHGQDDHARRRAVRHDRQRETEDPGQGGHPARPAAPHLRGQAAGRWPHAERLQHPEGVDLAPRPAPPRRPLPGALRHLRRPEARVGAPRGLRDDREGHGPDHGALRQDGRGPARHQPDDALGEHEGGALREDHRPRRELCGNQNPTARLC